MRSWKSTVGGATYRLVQTAAQLDVVCALADREPVLALDTETTGLDWTRAHVAGYVLGWGPNHNYYIPVNHLVSDADGVRRDPHQLDPEVARHRLAWLLGRPGRRYLFWNAKFDLHMLRESGCPVTGEVVDVMVAKHLTDENTPNALKFTAERLMGRKAGDWERALSQWRGDHAKQRGKWTTELVEARGGKKREARAQVLAERPWLARKTKADVTYDLVPLELITPYACADVHYTWVLWHGHFSEAAQSPVWTVETALTRALYETEHYGLPVDAEYLESIEPVLSARVEAAENHVRQLAGDPHLNLNSPKQLVAFLQAQGVPLDKYSKGSREKLSEGTITEDEATFSTESKVLEFIDHPAAKSILEFRDAFKLRNTYCRGIRELAQVTGRVHSNFNQNVSTGRMSSSEPNLQNIPRETDPTLSVKRGFVVPGPEWVYVMIDYSQVELRVLAHLSQDPQLLACYPWEGEGMDMHALTAATCLGLSLEDFYRLSSDKQKFWRSIAKQVNFGIAYGGNAWTVHAQVNKPDMPVTLQQCKDMVNAFPETYVKVPPFQAATVAHLHQHGWVANMWGRRRNLPDAPRLSQRPKWDRGAARLLRRLERQANNFVIQSAAADIFKTAIVRVHKLLQDKRSYMCNFVHDDLQLMVHRTELWVVPEVVTTMEDFGLTVPLHTEVEWSTTSWGAKQALPRGQRLEDIL